MKISSEPPTVALFFVGRSRRRDWNFRARLKISIEIEHFERDWILLIAGPSGYRFITFERFARIASNLRFAIFSAPKPDAQKRGSVQEPSGDPRESGDSWVFLEWGHQNQDRTAHVGPSRGNMISHIFSMISRMFFFSLCENARSSLKWFFSSKMQDHLWNDLSDHL